MTSLASNIKTTCPYCGVGCGITASVSDELVSITGDADHPANNGILCSKGMALAETLDHTDRLLSPIVNGQQTNWEFALKKVAQGFKQCIDKYGPDSVAFYVSGQLLTEDYYVANKLMKGYIGSGNIDTNSRLCMSSSVAGHKRAFGADIVPGNYEDWDETDLAVLVGSNAAWCHPILFSRLLKAQKTRGAKIVIIDPRHTASCDMADLHLPLLPGTDVVLFNGLLSYLAQHNAIDAHYVATHTNGMSKALKLANQDAPDIATVAQKCGLDAAKVSEFYQLFVDNERALSIYSQGVNQSSSGTDKVNSIINCHLYTGRIGKPGMGPFSVTGQPNAMGGREVGGLANVLAAHMDFTPKNVDLVSRFWDAPNIATQGGAKAVDLFDKIADGKIKAVWIMATNPAVSMPNANKVRDALAKCPLVVVSDCMNNTDSMQYADVKLPAMTWGEKDGTVTNSERRISRQRRFLDPAGMSKPDWWIICQVAKYMGFEKSFAYQNVSEIYQEHSQLSAFENDGENLRAFNIGLHADISEKDYNEMAPTQWPITEATPYGTERMLQDGEFFNQTRKANFVAIKHQAPVHETNQDYPLILNSGRIRDQWHTMSRTGKSAKLNNQFSEPFVYISAQDAQRFGVKDNDFVQIFSWWGKALVRAYIDEKQPDGQIFMPMHWTEIYSSAAVIGRLVNPATDSVSGQPELKHTPVSLKVWRPAWHGFYISHQKLAPAELTADKQIKYWAYNCQNGCHILNLAGVGEVADVGIIDQLKTFAKSKLLSYEDSVGGHYRYANVENNRLKSCFVATNQGELPPLEWLQNQMSRKLDIADKLSYLLSGISQDKVPNLGPIVCSCLGIYQQQIKDSIKANGLTSVDQVVDLLKAGSNCGSCLSEINQLLPQRSAV
ncbi:MAG: molybdopterin-dependent oxidoreductase [Hyphomicrobiales bacterium]|nr:molybdopterin-dependent oxidoreductase [Hyphomicrobiales bacterium]